MVATSFLTNSLNGRTQAGAGVFVLDALSALTSTGSIHCDISVGGNDHLRVFFEHQKA